MTTIESCVQLNSIHLLSAMQVKVIFSKKSKTEIFTRNLVIVPTLYFNTLDSIIDLWLLASKSIKSTVKHVFDDHFRFILRIKSYCIIIFSKEMINHNKTLN